MGKDFSDYYRHQADMEEAALSKRAMDAINVNHGLGYQAGPPSFSAIPPPTNFVIPVDGPPNIFTWIGFAVLAVIIAVGIGLFQEAKREIDNGMWTARATYRSASGSGGWGQTQSVTVANQPVNVSIYRRSRHVWVATGAYGNHLVQTTGHSPAAAARRWRAATERAEGLRRVPLHRSVARRLSPAPQTEPAPNGNAEPPAPGAPSP